MMHKIHHSASILQVLCAILLAGCARAANATPHTNPDAYFSRCRSPCPSSTPDSGPNKHADYNCHSNIYPPAASAHFAAAGEHDDGCAHHIAGR